MEKLKQKNHFFFYFIIVVIIIIYSVFQTFLEPLNISFKILNIQKFLITNFLRIYLLYFLNKITYIIIHLKNRCE